MEPGDELDGDIRYNVEPGEEHGEIPYNKEPGDELDD